MPILAHLNKLYIERQLGHIPIGDMHSPEWFSALREIMCVL